MRKVNRFFIVLVFAFCSAGLLFSAEGRFALVIGNGAYRDNDISNLANPANDAADVAEAMKGQGYDVTLKTNIGLRDMLSVVRAFTADLKKDPGNEGFFWFAGHGLSVKGVHYMLPVDVDPYDDDSIPRTSFSVDDLMEEIEKAGNITNLIVIDACRNNVIPGSRSVAGRGLAVLSRDDYRVKGNKLVYSTMAGMVAADGVPGGRNSPFAQAFIDKIKTPEPFDDVFLDIANETLRLTNGNQEPYSLGTFAVKSYVISIEAKDTKAAQYAEIEAAVQAILGNANVSKKRADPDYKLDGKRVMGLSANVSAFPSTFTEGGFGGGLGFAFYEKYRKYGEFFYIPNSFFFSADFFRDARKIESQLELMSEDGQERYIGGVLGLGALYKIRIGESQRFIVNFGPSVEMFLLSAQFYYKDTRRFYSKDGEESETRFIPAPGFGVHGGLSFRFNPILSLDFGVAWKQAFIRSGEIELQAVHGSGQKETLVFSEGIFPYTLGGFLGLTFWWLR